MLTRSHAARKERRRRKSEMKRMLAARMAARQEAEREHLDAWFREFDKNDDRRLDKKELAALLMTLQPEAPPSDETLDRLMREAKLEDDQHEPVHREQLARVVLKNLSYVKEAQFIDTLFDRFDEDKSGSLDRDELKGLMHSIALGDVKVFPPGDPAYAQAACIAYKFKCLEDLMAKGVIDEPYFREKRARVAGQEKRAKFPTSKAPISVGFHSFWLIFGRAIISRNGLEAWMLLPERARAEHSR